jgi:hypothetical protein
VDEWIGTYPALKELDRREVWFRPMMDLIAQRLLAEVPWGLKLRVFLGAALSVMDLASDISVIILYMATPGKEGYGRNLTSMIATKLFCEMYTVYLQNRKRGPSYLFKEICIVLTGLKPGK